VTGDFLFDPAPELLTVTILRYRRGWRVMWIGTGKKLSDFRAATLTAAATRATGMAADIYRASAAGAAAEFLILIFGRRLPVFDGLSLLVTGGPGQLTATDARNGSVFTGATLEDLLTAAAANPAQAGDYAISWMRSVSAIRSDP
jgi:hypothetical protein